MYGIRGWDGENGGHWVAIFGITLILPQIMTGSWVLAGIIHWVVCTTAVGFVSVIVLIARRLSREGTAARG